MQIKFDPFHPMRHLIKEMSAEGSMPPFMSPMLVHYRRETNDNTLSGFIDYLKRLDGASPELADLDPTPELVRWCLVKASE